MLHPYVCLCGLAVWEDRSLDFCFPNIRAFLPDRAYLLLICCHRKGTLQPVPHLSGFIQWRTYFKHCKARGRRCPGLGITRVVSSGMSWAVVARNQGLVPVLDYTEAWLHCRLGPGDTVASRAWSHLSWVSRSQVGLRYSPHSSGRNRQLWSFFLLWKAVTTPFVLPVCSSCLLTWRSRSWLPISIPLNHEAGCL